MKPLVPALALILALPGLAARDITVHPGDSLFLARDAAKAGDRVVIQGGVHRLDRTLVLGPENSGVSWVAAPGETPVISGGVPVSGWSPDTGGVWKVKLDRREKLRQLIVNGRPAIMAAGPQVKPKGWCGEFIIKGDEPWAADGRGKAHDGFVFSKSDLPDFKETNQADIELRQRETWTTQHVCFREILEENGTLHALFAQPSAAAASKILWGQGLGPRPVELFNAREFVNEPGEFYFNSRSGILFYLPRPGEDMTKAQAVMPVVETLLCVRGVDLGKHASGIRFEGVAFEDSAYALTRMGASAGHVTVQGTHVQTYYKNSGNQHTEPMPIYATQDVAPAAVFVANADGIDFSRCTFRNLGCLGLNLENDVTKARVTGCVFLDIEGGGVNVGHPQQIYIGKMNGDNRGYGPYGIDNSRDKYDEAREGLCRDFHIGNNLFRNICTRYFGMVGVMVYYGHDFEIAHNDMEHLPYSGISVGWGWSEGSPGKNGLYGAGKQSAGNRDGSKPSLSIRNYRVMGNRIWGFCEKLHDGGGIYTLGYADVNMKDGKPACYSRIAGNYEHTVSRHADHCVYPDEGSGTLEIEDNVFDIPTLTQAFQFQARAGKHDIKYRRNRINVEARSGAEYDRNLPAFSDYSENHYFKPTVRPTPVAEWSEEARKIIGDAGLEPEFRDLLAP